MPLFKGLLSVVRRGPLSPPRPEVPGRVLLAAIGLLVLYLDPPDYAAMPQAMNPLLVAYLTFASILLLRELKGIPSSPRIDWLDLAWILTLTSVTGGTSSVLFFMLLLPIISRSFRDGFDAGWRMSCITTLGLLIVGLPTSPGGVLFEFNRAMIRPLTLLIIGYILAREGGNQHRSLKQLALLASIHAVGNPRFGADRTLLHAARRLRDAYKVNECLIILRRDHEDFALCARSGQSLGLGQDQDQDQDQEIIERLPEQAASVLLSLAHDVAVIYSAGRVLAPQKHGADLEEKCLVLSDVLGRDALLSVALPRQGQIFGRLYLLDAQMSHIDERELAFIVDAAAQLMLIVERIDLQERLASVAAQRERLRLAHDLHDLAIQPYLGVQLGLSAAMRRADCPAHIAEELRGLQKLAEQGVSELRGILDAQRVDRSGDEAMSQALLRLADHYRAQFAMDVRIERAPNLRISDRLAGEVLAMVKEALSNVRRHTAAASATISLSGDDESLLLLMRNPRAGAEPVSFTPKSISTRASELGGDWHLEHEPQGDTILRVRIPL